MNGRSPQSWPENIERVMELGEGNGYAQPWESVRKGQSLLAELAEKTGRDVDALTPSERIAFRIGWVRGRIRKYEEAGTVDPAEIAHAKENEEFYRKKLQEVLERPAPSPESSPAPYPVSPPEREGLPEPAPEAAAETPGFSRYLKDILADPAAPEAVNLLIKFRSPNGRLWVDRKRADGSAVRIWFSLNLTPEEKSKPDAEFIAIIKGKLAPGGLRFRVDDLSAGHSWKEKWTTKKADISALVAGVAAASETEHPAACARIAEALFGTEETAKPNREALLALLQQYLARPDGKSDIWTHVRNAYWHSEPWEADLAKVSSALGAPFTIPTYEKARVKTWEKMDARASALLAPAGRYAVRVQGKDAAEYSLAERKEKDGKTSYHFAGLGWVREDDLRICEKKEKQSDGSWKPVAPAAFELMAWKATATPAGKPKTTPAIPPSTTIPPAAPGGPKPPPKSPPIPPTPKSVPTAKPAESKESAEVLREREVIAIPDIHGEANVLLTSLKAAGYIEPKDAKWEEGWHLTEAGQKAHIVFTGDLLDRGSENIGVLEIVKKLRAGGARIEILAGNHEMILLNTLQSSHQSDWLHWIDNGGGSVLKELGKHAHISTNAVTILDVLSYLPYMDKHKKNFTEMPPVTASCAELLSWWKKNSSKITQTINDPTDQSIRSTLEHTSITDADIAAFGKLQERAKETFLVQYGEMVKSLNLMTIVDDVLYVHASLNEYWIDMLEREGIDGVNREFHTAIKDPRKLREMAGSTGQYGDVMWDRKLQGKLKNKPELIRRLKQLGICMIVHGHTETNGAQMHNTVDNLHIVNGDVGMYRRPGGAFVRVRGRRHKDNGKVEGFVGASRSPYDKTGYTALASLSPGKEKPAPTTAAPGTAPL